MRKTAFLSLLIVFVTPWIWAVDYYVSPAGSDSNSGTLSQPWQTIQHAAETAVAGDTVYIRDGIYNEHVFTEHSGDAVNGYIVFSAYSGETPVIDGTGVTCSQNGIIVAHSYIKLIGLDIRNWQVGIIMAFASSRWELETTEGITMYSIMTMPTGLSMSAIRMNSHWIRWRPETGRHTADRMPTPWSLQIRTINFLWT